MKHSGTAIELKQDLFESLRDKEKSTQRIPNICRAAYRQQAEILL